MKILSLVENTTLSDLKTKHGLSLYIETNSHKILFDLGPDETLFENAASRNIDLTQVDTVIISHGHNDHGGALERFLEINHTAKIYIQNSAFDPHYSKALFIKVPIGLNRRLKSNSQIILLNGDYQIDRELFLFTVKDSAKCHSTANDTLYDEYGKDTFLHEQNLIIIENQTALIMGCGHTGIVNIMEKASEYAPKLCVGGFHLYSPSRQETVPDSLLDAIVENLKPYSQTKFYTCHCTGKQAYTYLSQQMDNMFYFSCGEEII